MEHIYQVLMLDGTPNSLLYCCNSYPYIMMHAESSVFGRGQLGSTYPYVMSSQPPSDMARSSSRFLLEAKFVRSWRNQDSMNPFMKRMRHSSLSC